MAEPDPLGDLGVRVDGAGGTARVWSHHASALELCVFDPRDPEWIVDRVPLERDGHDVWSGESPRLTVGARYALRASGPRGAAHDFDADRNLIDPYARGLVRTPGGEWRGYVQDDAFDWGGVRRPATPLDRSVIYEAHAKGFTALNRAIPAPLRGTYAGLAHPAAIDHLAHLGVTALELLPIQQFRSERRLVKSGLTNYWGYNTLNFFTPHAEWASRGAQIGGTGAVLREVKGMVRALHEAGIEVILDVVYNHTSEEGRDGPTSSLRGLDNASYYRHAGDGAYIDTTGCGNTLDASLPAAQRLVLDSLRYWAEEVQVDGFRFDLAATLGRDAGAVFDPRHPLLEAIVSDPTLTDLKMIAEPWDIGLGGWQTGSFPRGFSEWNDGFRDDVRQFWLGDIAHARAHGTATQGAGALAGRIAGSSGVFSPERGPLASIDFVTAHDGFTLRDLVSFDGKHNRSNGEGGRDGTDDNRSWNHGAEGTTTDRGILAARRRAMRNLLGTLLLSAGMPMITAGDESGRSQRGNNNAYCHDSELTWMPWDLDHWQQELQEVVRTLIRLRSENPALRPVRFGRFGETVPSATQMDWFNAQGLEMSVEDWNSPSARTLQYLAASTPETEEPNRILLVVHGLETEQTVTLPEHRGVSGYTLLWDSSHDDVSGLEADFGPGDEYLTGPASMLLFRAS